MGSREFRVILRAKTFEDYEATVAFYRDGLELPVVASWNRDRDRGTLLRAASGQGILGDAVRPPLPLPLRRLNFLV